MESQSITCGQGASSFPVARRVLKEKTGSTDKITTAYIYQKIAGGANKQDHFEATDGIRKYMRLVFDMFATTWERWNEEKGAFLH